MKKMVFVIAVSAVLAATPAMASKRYEGQEAVAIRCAVILAVVPTALAEQRVISRENAAIMQLMSASILRQHVSGSERQKMSAFRTLMRRTDPQKHVRDFQTRSKTCLRQFPIR